MKRDPVSELTTTAVGGVIGGAGPLTPSPGQPLDRTTYIGSSDAPLIAGVSSYGTPMTVWMRKTGLADQPVQSLRMRIGKMLEPILLTLYTERTGRLPEPGPDPEVDPPVLAEGFPFIGAHPDFERLEVKTTRSGKGWGEEGIATVDDMLVPLPVFIQVQHQLLVTGWEWSDVAVLVGHDDFKVYTVPADPTVIAALLLAEQEMWGYVARNEPPPDEDPESRRAYLRARFPVDVAPMRGATPEELALVEDWRALKRVTKKAEEEEERIANRLREAIGDAAGLEGVVSLKGFVRKSIDSAAVKAVFAERGLDLDLVTQRTTVRSLRDLAKGEDDD